MKKMSEKKEWTNGNGRTNRKSGEMLNTRALGDQNSGKSGKKNSLCPHFKSCGGCQYLDMPYEKQLEHKKKEVATFSARSARSRRSSAWMIRSITEIRFMR